MSSLGGYLVRWLGRWSLGVFVKRMFTLTMEALVASCIPQTYMYSADGSAGRFISSPIYKFNNTLANPIPTPHAAPTPRPRFCALP